ncbi:MAG: hypothetical protein KA735_06550 [Burkholderiaceae bacterium]|nr:hypothetical protein [Burkholderiaceae bacterium]
MTPGIDDVTQANASGISWAAVFAGAAAAAALSLILLILGSGLGFAAISPWSSEGATAATLGISAIVWLAVTQIIASGLGGYLAGRLRVRWSRLHADEVYFRDTAHGMLSWAVATLVTAAFLGSALTGLVGGSARMAANVATPVLTAVAAGGASAAANSSDSSSAGPLGYFVDTLFRSDQASTGGDTQQTYRQAITVLGHAMTQGSLSDQDSRYLATLVAQRTGMDQAQAQQRVTQVYGELKQTVQDAENAAKSAADTARKTAAATALWMFVALLCGAFFASLMGIYGGRRRDADDITLS